MRVAVVIPTCDRPDLLPRALASVAGQRRPPDEVIIVNDGVRPVDAPGARVVRSGPYAGPGAARNVGADATRADVIAFLDDDDEWLHDYLSSVLPTLDSADLALTSFIKEGSGGERVFEKVPPTTLHGADWVIRNQGLRGSNVVVRGDTFRRLGGFDELLSCGEDMDFAIRAAEARVSYRRVAEPLVVYHAHDGARLTSRGPRHRQAHRTWLAAQGDRLGPDQVAAYRARTQELFGVDPGPPPSLVWILGPPGAGKTTWAKGHARGTDRVMDVDEILFWRDGADLGVRTAKRHLASMVRSVEEQRPVGDRRLFVTAAYLDPEDLGVLGSREHVIGIVPARTQWIARIERRDGYVHAAHAEEHTKWATRWGIGARAADAVGEAGA